MTANVEKAELHCHSDELLDAQMLRELLAEGYAIDLDPEVLTAVTPANSFNHWISGYLAATAGKLDAEATIATISKHIERLIRQNVVYAEIFVSGYLMPDRPLAEAIRFYESLHESISATAGDRIQIELLAGIGRKKRSSAEGQFNRAIELYNRGLIVGLAYAGDYNSCTVASISDLFEKAHASGMGIEIHAGETRGPDCVRDALDYGRPHRIGHGLAIFQDERLLERILREDIHLEFCPTSNLILTDVRLIQSHPIDRARKLGMCYSVNTDDPGAFDCSLESEFKLLEEKLGFDSAEFERILDNTRKASFAARRCRRP